MKAIVFDFGNVVGFFDHRPALAKLAAHTDLTPEALYEVYTGSSLEDEYESGQLTTAEFIGRLRERCQLCCDEAFITETVADIFWPNEDVCALLPLLRPRYKLLLGSNTNDIHATKFKVQFAGPLSHFDALVLSHEIGHRKPKAAFFEHCQRLAGCAPAECVFIDDLTANVEGARACGWHGIVYRGDGQDLRRRLGELGVVVG